jgi:hypothetical protein
MVIMKLKEHKNLAIRAKVMEYLSRMNKEDFPTSRDEVLETLIELEIKASIKLPSVVSISKEQSKKEPKIINFSDCSDGFAHPVGLFKFGALRRCIIGKLSGSHNGGGF